MGSKNKAAAEKVTADAGAVAASLKKIDRGKLDAKTIDGALAALDIVPADGADLEAKVRILAQHFETIPEDSKSDCDNCGGMSDFQLPCCPFCGSGEDPSGSGAVAPPDDDEDPGDVPPGDEDEQEDEAPASAAPPPPPPPPPAAKPAKPAKGKKGGANLAVVPPPAPEVKAEVVSKEDAAKLDGIAALDADVAEIKRLNRGTSAGYYLLAKKLAEVSQSGRWKLRVGEDGKPSYKNFEAFTLAELGIGRKYAQQLTKTAVRFTLAEFEQFGPTKLRFVLEAPKEQQEEMLRKLKDGATTRGLQAESKERRKKAGLKARGNSEARSAGKKQAAGKVTIGVMEGKKTYTLWKKPSSKDAPRVAAKHLSDTPWAEIELMNDAVMWVTVVRAPDGKLKAVVDVRRKEV